LHFMSLGFSNTDPGQVQPVRCARSLLSCNRRLIPGIQNIAAVINFVPRT
jgi:hypothetical protein